MLEEKPMTEKQLVMYHKAHKILIDNYAALIKTLTRVDVHTVESNQSQYLAAPNVMSGEEMDALLGAVVDAFGVQVGSLIAAIASQIPGNTEQLLAPILAAYVKRFDESVKRDLRDMQNHRAAYAKFLDGKPGQQYGTA